MKNFLLHKFSLLIVLLLVAACSTEKNTAVNRAYHNVTSHYNIYFNGKESIKAGLARIDESVEDDYTQILPIFKTSISGTERTAAAEMDYAIMKASKLIKVHSISKKPKRRKNRSASYKNLASKDEYNNWVDDSYIMLGKAYFYQKMYPQAMENFNFVIRKFPLEETRFEAMVWLIRCLSEQERYTEASELIKEIDSSMDFPKKLDQDFSLAVADYHLKQFEYDETIPELKSALNDRMPKKQKARLTYILAQLYEKTGQNELAIASYLDVAKMHTSYNMAFNARIQAAGVYTESTDKEKLVKTMRKLLKDEKNVEFRDQIYYALAQVDLYAGNESGAIDNLKKSSATSVSNDYQKALSSITLADIYFENQEYVLASAYYDTAITVIDEEYPNYRMIENRQKSLALLAHNLQTVQREDSLQALANLSDAERNAKISAWIEAERDAELRRKQQENQEMQDLNFYKMNQSRFGTTSQSTSSWYFYNPTTITLGKNEFQQIWGKRKLEDNWRRKNKSQISEMDDDALALEEAEAGADSAQVEAPRVNDRLSREYYTQDLPMTEEAMEQSNIRIRDALFNAGRLFKQDFENYPKAISTYEDLINRFDENIYRLTTYFELWDLYTTIGNTTRANYYKNLIIGQYPDSKYAQYLVNPNYFIELEAHQDSINLLYQQAYTEFRSGQYRQAGTLAHQVMQMEPDSVMLPKLAFMETIARGDETKLDEFGQSLDVYISSYPKSPVKPLAEKIRQLIADSTLVDYQKLVASGYLNNEIVNTELLEEQQDLSDEFNGKFSYDTELLHYFVIAFDRSAEVDINRLKFDVANYNIDHYMKTDFDIETEHLNANTTLLTVRSLQNKEQALIYFRSIIRKKEVYKTLQNVNYVNFVVSSYNYREMKSDYSYETYLKFFLKNYSRFIGGDFPEDELPEPEELMAKALEEEQALEERGSFVMVTPSSKETLYSQTPDAPHAFVIAVSEEGADMRGTSSLFNIYNRKNYADRNLNTGQKAFSNNRLLVVSGFTSANDALSYFRSVITDRSLFERLGNASYRNFIISESNLETLMQQSTIDPYITFFRDYYISGQANTDLINKQQAEEEQQKIEEEATALPAYEGAFSTNTEGEHDFILLIPDQGVNLEDLLDAIERHNDQTDRSGKLQIESRPFANKQLLIRVYPHNDRQDAMDYLRSIVRNANVYRPLGQLEYRNFIISKDNYELLLKTQDLDDYLNLYKSVYLSK